MLTLDEDALSVVEQPLMRIRYDERVHLELVSTDGAGSPREANWYFQLLVAPYKPKGWQLPYCCAQTEQFRFGDIPSHHELFDLWNGAGRRIGLTLVQLIERGEPRISIICRLNPPCGDKPIFTVEFGSLRATGVLPGGTDFLQHLYEKSLADD